MTYGSHDWRLMTLCEFGALVRNSQSLKHQTLKRRLNLCFPHPLLSRTDSTGSGGGGGGVSARSWSSSIADKRKIRRSFWFWVLWLLVFFLILGEWDDLCPISGHIVLQDSASITQLDKRFVALVRDWRCCFASHCRLFRCENERRRRMHPSTSRPANKFCEGASRDPPHTGRVHTQLVLLSGEAM